MNLAARNTVLLFILITLGAFNSYGQQDNWFELSAHERALLESQKLTKKLGLSTGQSNEVEKISEKKFSEADELIGDREKDAEDRADDLLAIWQDWDKELQQLLEDNQMRSYAEIKVDYKEKLFSILDQSNPLQMDADIMEDDYKEIEEELESEEDLDDALQGAEDVEFD